MKALTLLPVLFISIASHAQTFQPAKTRFLTYYQNENWLKTVQSLNRSQQLEEIKLRFFSKENHNVQFDSVQYSPLIVANGVPMNLPETLNEQYISEVLSLLNKDSVDQITILNKLSDKWIFCKPFAGVILLAMDKRLSNKLLNLKLR